MTIIVLKLCAVKYMLHQNGNKYSPNVSFTLVRSNLVLNGTCTQTTTRVYKYGLPLSCTVKCTAKPWLTKVVATQTSEKSSNRNMFTFTAFISKYVENKWSISSVGYGMCMQQQIQKNLFSCFATRLVTILKAMKMNVLFPKRDHT